MSGQEVVVLIVGQEDGTWHATGLLADGSHYLAVAESRDRLDAQIRESAAAEGWRGWVTTTVDATVQIGNTR